MLERYDELNNTDKENFKRIISLILSKTFIVNRIYDKNQNSFKYNSDYRFIERNTELFNEYLGLAGFKLLKDNNYEVIYIENEYGYNKKRLDKNTTIFLYGLRLIYDEERGKARLNSDVIVSTAEIIDRLIQAGAYTKKLPDMEIRNALSNLISFNIIQKIDGALEKPETKIIILPSILFAITNEKIEAVKQSIDTKEFKNAEELELENIENDELGEEE